MSAFFVGVDHINAMLTVAKALKVYVPSPTEGEPYRQADRLPQESFDALGRLLIEENIKSLAARYPDDYAKLLNKFKVDDYKFVEDDDFLQRHALTDAIHLVECYEYQSCEHDGWEGSWAHKFSNALARKAALTIPESIDPGGLGRCWSYSTNEA